MVITRKRLRSSLGKPVTPRQRESQLGIPMAPTFYPSTEEFTDALSYIHKIAEKGEKYGIVKVVPPSNWHPKFYLSMEQFHFPTRRQELKMMNIHFRTKADYDERMYRFFKNKNADLPVQLKIQKKPVDIYMFRCAIQSTAGTVFGSLSDKQWSSVLERIDLRPNPSSIRDAKSLHRRFILPFETFVAQIRTGKPDSDKVKLNGKDDLGSAVAERESSDIASQSKLQCNNCHSSIPSQDQSPRKEFYCDHCIAFHDSFGFEPGGSYTLSQFKKKDSSFKKRYFGSTIQSDHENEVESEYWRLMESSDESMVVEYGADLSTTEFRSAFPTLRTDADDPYASDEWNLNRMPTTEKSLLQHIHSQISGITVPWLYVGMCFSTFCWHMEDNYTYSINYQHMGATKTWYGIPGTQADSLLELASSLAPEVILKEPDLMHQLNTIINPKTLLKNNVDVYFLDQHPNEFIITFPKAFHSGFNHGFNVNEAVNFAPADWLLNGHSLNSIIDYAKIGKQPAFSHDELLTSMCESTETIDLTFQPWVEEMINREMFGRANVRKHLSLNEYVNPEESNDRQHFCVTCSSICFLSRISCQCQRFVYCLNHFREAASSCKCERKYSLICYMSDGSLTLLRKKFLKT
ncbi:histone demethylase Jmj2 [Schizosaccharomyces japonicus yFS275]|uniref:Histone demethylase Jmj2 n=1 Tax=Schizosaccharomyces japonicus (strain yFS275 / FY16936) TaxID=402676 RepID=B6K3U5_SCHJY|nr:histone demethylase Jmj2 [Schizosaccharomyces japonicus yFS275]EEB08152.1 histone demethylase Jmj2 [Schizosaccharomyces japonicus yFS275]